MEQEHHHHEHPSKDHSNHPVKTGSMRHNHSELKMTRHDNDAIDHSAHDKHAGHHTENFLTRFWVCLILTIPILLLSHMVQQWFGFGISFAGDNVG